MTTTDRTEDQYSRCGRPATPNCCHEPPSWVTAKSLTDAEIREVLEEAARMDGDVVLHGQCEIALGIRRNRHGRNQRERARAAIAAAINARKAVR